MLDEQEEWLVNKAEISTKIEEGYAAAQRGELIEGDRVRTEMDVKKRLALSKAPRMLLKSRCS